MIAQNESDRSHAEIQAWLRDLGLALGYDVWIAANDRGRVHDGMPLETHCLDHLPNAIATAAGGASILLIDVLWLERSQANMATAFEVEHSSARPTLPPKVSVESIGESAVNLCPRNLVRPGHAMARTQIRAVGSSTVYPFTTVAAECFARANPNFGAPIIDRSARARA